MGLRCMLLTTLALAAFGASASGAEPPVVAGTLAPNPIGAPELGVDASGGAVVAWLGFASMRGPGGREFSSDALFASARPAGGAFGARRLISTGGREAARGFALAVGLRGDAAVVWHRMSRRGARGPLLVNRRLPARSFRAPVPIPGSAGGREPAAGIDARGTLLVAWLRSSGHTGCGAVVMASVAPRGARFGTPRRLSGACPNAALLRAALGPTGRGAVAWRVGRNVGYARSSYAVEASRYAHARFSSARRLSTGRAAASTLALAAGRGTLVAWRDQAAITRAGATGRVLIATVDGARTGDPVPVSASEAVVGPVHAALNTAGAAIVTWEERSGRRPPVVVSAVRPAPGAPFGPPEAVAPCGATDASRTGSRAALDAAGNALVAFQTACGPNHGLAAARKRLVDPWQAPFMLSSGGYAVGVKVGLSDAGEGIATWSESGPDFRSGAVRAAVLPAPALTASGAS